ALFSVSWERFAFSPTIRKTWEKAGTPSAPPVACAGATDVTSARRGSARRDASVRRGMEKLLSSPAAGSLGRSLRLRQIARSRSGTGGYLHPLRTGALTARTSARWRPSGFAGRGARMDTCATTEFECDRAHGEAARLEHLGRVGRGPGRPGALRGHRSPREGLRRP